jgi:hypothetical protein
MYGVPLVFDDRVATKRIVCKDNRDILKTS